MVGHGGSSAGSYLADPTSPIPSHCASIAVTSRVNTAHRNIYKSSVKIIPVMIVLFCDQNTHRSQWNPILDNLIESFIPIIRVYRRHKHLSSVFIRTVYHKPRIISQTFFFIRPCSWIDNMFGSGSPFPHSEILLKIVNNKDSMEWYGRWWKYNNRESNEFMNQWAFQPMDVWKNRVYQSKHTL